MMTNETLVKLNYEAIGEPINHELAAKMVKDYEDAYPGQELFYCVGKNIINQILSQPGCVAMRFHNAIDENGNHTLVYAGVDKKGATIMEITAVNKDGQIAKVDALIGDRTTGEGGWW